jgi:hypothetical protein
MFPIAPNSPPVPLDPCPQIYDPVVDEHQHKAPSIEAAYAALLDIAEELCSSWNTEHGHVDPKLDPFRRSHIQEMESMLVLYTNAQSCTLGHWEASSLYAAFTMQQGTYCERTL